MSKERVPHLVGTSQGKKNEVPPRQWIREELTQFGTISTPADYIQTLTNDFPFKAKNFKMSATRFKAMDQALRLSARLLVAGLPYICNFLPKLRASEELSNFQRMKIKEDFSPEEMAAAKYALFNNVFPLLTWTEDAELWPKSNAMGVCHTGRRGPSYALQVEGPSDWASLAWEAAREGSRW